MEDLILRYLKYGCAYDYPDTVYLPQKNVMEYDEIKGTLYDKISKAITKIPNPNQTIFQLSGGFDSSLVVSYFKKPKTFCTGAEDSLDREYSWKASDFLHTSHAWVGHDEILNQLDFINTTVEMNKINRHPRSFKNDFGLYGFLKYIKEHTDYVSGGKGIEFQMLGYCSIYNKIVEHAISRGEYSVEKAEEYLELRGIKCTEDMIPLDIGGKHEGNYSLDEVQWWNGTFTQQEIFDLTGINKPSLEFETLDEILVFLFDWFGREYVTNRVEDYSKHFNITCYSPYLDKEVVEFTKTIPVELKKCMNHHKYIFYQAMGHRLPTFICERSKVGLNTSMNYYKRHYVDILHLINIYLKSEDSKLYDYLDFKVVNEYIKEFESGFEDWIFQKVWSLLNLSIWMEENNENTYS